MIKRKNTIILAFLANVVLFQQSACASSPDAWKELENQVKAKCAERFNGAIGKQKVNPTVNIDVMGGQNVVSAIIRYDDSRSKTRVHSLCLYSKAEKKVIEFYELSRYADEKAWIPLGSK